MAVLYRNVYNKVFSALFLQFVNQCIRVIGKLVQISLNFSILDPTDKTLCCQTAVVATHSDSVSGPTSPGTRSRPRTGALLVHNLNILELAEWLAKSAWSASEEISQCSSQSRKTVQTVFPSDQSTGRNASKGARTRAEICKHLKVRPCNFWSWVR